MLELRGGVQSIGVADKIGQIILRFWETIGCTLDLKKGVDRASIDNVADEIYLPENV
jgi:hypothetical protein